jgi:carboxyl-terminal processing protease
VRAELRPRAASARDAGELRTVLRVMLGRLADSHYGVIAAQAVAAGGDGYGGEHPGDVGIEVRLVDDRLVVARVRPASAAARAGVRPGWVIEHVDTLETRPIVAPAREAPAGMPRRVASVRAALVVEQYLAGAAGHPVRVRFRDERDHPVERTIFRDDVSADVVRFGSLPPMEGRVESLRAPIGTSCVGIIRLTAWLPTLAHAFERAVRNVRGCHGVVLDLRGNLGGVAAMVMGTSGWFMASPDTLGTLRMRRASLHYVAVPQLVTGDGRRLDPYSGQVAVLVDRHSASTSEIFAAGLQASGRARVFGDTTAGQALPATFLRLPDGDVFMYAVADFVTARGTRLEGRGVIPDEVHPLTRADLLAGRDAALAAALRWIDGRAPRRVETP